LKAVRFHSPGGPEVLTYEDAPDPVPGPSEALVRVRACGVNRIDIWLRSGRYKATLPHVLGADVAGEVASGGEGVPTGARVAVYPVLSDGTCEFCVKGMPNRCLSVGLLGRACDGGYAEYVKVPAASLVEIGDMDFETAACVPVNFGTAWNGLASRAAVGPGDTVLVWSAAGGLSHAAVEVAKLLGARVIAAVGDDEKVEFVRSLGADFVVNYHRDDIVQSVRSITDGYGASVVFDHIGGDTWGKSIDALAKGGRMVTLGLTSGPKSEVDVRRVYQDELSIVGTFSFSREQLIQVLGLVAEKKLKPRIYKTLPLASAQAAHETLESRTVQGKIVLIP